MTLALTAAHALTPLETVEDAVVLIEDHTIRAVSPRREIAIPPGARTVDLGEKILAPGFVDVHIHGAAGRDVMDGTPDALAAVAAFVLRHGTTSFVPTTLSASSEVLLPALEGLGKAIRSWKRTRSSSSHGTIAVPWAVASGFASETPLAEPLGIHLEGPFLSVDCRGVHPREHLQPPSVELFHRMLAAAGGSVRILTLAPELEGASALQAAATKAGVRVAIGHSNASYEQAIRAIDNGAAHAVHVFNAMRPFAHRDPGILGAILTDDRILAEVIADGVHVAPPALRLLLRSKSPSRVALVTDGISATGMAPGQHRLGGLEIRVAADPNTGRLACRNHEGKLAGSVLTQDRAVQNMMQLAGVTLREAVLMASYVPAQIAGVADRKGSLRPGFDADLVVLHPDGTVAGTVAGGVGNFC
jgi:N-acetylglucosamine-6-phosphate deacetylase